MKNQFGCIGAKLSQIEKELGIEKSAARIKGMSVKDQLKFIGGAIDKIEKELS